MLICLWERAYLKLFDRVCNEFTTQLVKYQLKVTQELLELGKLQDELLEVLLGFQSQTYSCRQMFPIDVLTRIENAFADLGMLKGSKQNNIVILIVKGRLTTRMKNKQLGFISELNPRRSGLVGVPREFNSWTFFRYCNRELILEIKTRSTLCYPR